MAETLIDVTGITVTHDETAGLQDGSVPATSTEDNDDDDVLFSTIPTKFSDRLTELSAPLTAIGAAESDGNVVTFSPVGELGNIALTDVDGALLDGDDSGLVTTDGQSIFLYTDTANDNIVLGRVEDEDGPIVFAIYLEETGGSSSTGAKLWTVQYAAIDHGDDGNDHDSPVDLTNKVHVTAFEAQSFTFANAPSGQNLFMAFGNASQALVITGEDPANESEGENVSSGNTVNSGQGGGSTTLGTDGQQIKAQKALVVTFVSGANPAYLAEPALGGVADPLSPTEATDEANIQFSGYVLAQAAEFTISQMTPGGNTTATVEIAAYLTADQGGDSYIDANPLVQGDTAINITTGSVEVLRGDVNVVGTAGVTVDYTGTGAVITGVRSDDVIAYETDGDHNRVLIRNDQPVKGSGSNVAFDLGGFGLTEVAGDTDEIGSNIFFEDDGPTISENAGVLLDDDALAGGNPGGTGDDDAANTSDTLGHSFGADGAGSVAWLTSGAPDGFSYVPSGDNLLIQQGGITVLTLTLDTATGAYTVTQNAPIAHAAGGDENNQAFTVGYQVTDGDGDTATGSIGINVDDDTPTVSANAGVLLDDDALAGGNPGGTGDDDAANTSDTLGHSFGADGAGSVAWLTSGAPDGFSYVPSGDNLLIQQGGITVLTLTLDTATGAYTVTQNAPIAHAAGGDENNQAFTVGYQVTDGDGDTATGSIGINVDDDTPTVLVDDASGSFTGGAQGTWSDDSGADGFKSLSVTLNSYSIGTNTEVIVGTSLGTVLAPDADGNYVFDGSITGDFTNDGVANSQTVNFDLTFDPDADTYDLQLDDVPTSVVSFDTAQGKLAAGGPDAVQTLLFGGSSSGNDDIVFFGAVATAVRSDGDPTTTETPPNDVLDLVVPGEPDLTEQQIEAKLPLPNLINASTQMNVSTAGIGLNNNNLDSTADQGQGTGTFAGTTITPGDESFVVNPETLVDTVKVYISSTVQGYDTSKEDLYYTVYYADGSVSGPLEVNAGMLTHYASNDTTVPKEAKGGSSFTIDGGDKQIDAVQLTMGLGTVKIPVIAFTVDEEFNPQPLNLDFTAELFDGDSDSDDFSIDLFDATV